MSLLRFLFVAVILFSFLGLTPCNLPFDVDKDKSRAYAHYMMGILFDQLNKTQEALSEFEQSKRYDPDSDTTNLKIAVEYIKLGQENKAVDELNRSLELNPDNLQARTLLAFVYSSLGELQLAEIQYEIVLKQVSKEDPENLATHQYLGQLYFQQKKYDKALEQFKFILDIDPKDVNAKLFTGLIFDEQGLRTKAIAEFKGILEFEPENPDALNALGYVYAQMGKNLNEAEELINKALEQHPDNAAYIDSLGWVYFKKGEFEKAQGLLEEASRLLEDPVIFDHLGDVYSGMGEFEKAQDIWQRSIKLKTIDEATKKGIEDKLKKLIIDND